MPPPARRPGPLPPGPARRLRCRPQDRAADEYDILIVQAELERNRAGFCKLPGTALRGGGGSTIPVLYLSRHIVRTKADYYRLLQETRDRDSWEEWVLYMLAAVEQTAADGIATIQAIKALLMDYKHRIRAGYRFYSQDLINNLFSYPYTKIEFVENKVSRLTATKYLEALVAGGFVHKRKIGRSNYYINVPLYGILTGEGLTALV